MDVDRQGLKRVEDKPQGWLAWGKSRFGGGEEKPHAEKKDFADYFNKAMAPEAKAKLYEAIGFQGNIPPTYCPKEFVENKFDFRFGQVAVIVDGAVSTFLLDLRAGVAQRPSANAMDLKSTIQELRMDGYGAEMWRTRDPSSHGFIFVLTHILCTENTITP